MCCKKTNFRFICQQKEDATSKLICVSGSGLIFSESLELQGVASALNQLGILPTIDAVASSAPWLQMNESNDAAVIEDNIPSMFMDVHRVSAKYRNRSSGKMTINDLNMTIQ